MHSYTLDGRRDQPLLGNVFFDLTASGVGDLYENGERKRYYVASLISLINAVTGVTGA